jgi:hypothetical protein
MMNGSDAVGLTNAGMLKRGHCLEKTILFI